MKLIIMCGLPFSGKTTLSEQIAKYTKSKRLSFDELWLELETSSNNLNWSFVVNEAKKRIAEYLNAGESVVYDDTNVKKEHRDVFVSMAKDYQIELKIIYLDIPKEIILKRREENLTSQTRHDVENHNFDSVFGQFEKPNLDKNVIFFKTDDVVEEWLKANFSR